MSIKNNDHNEEKRHTRCYVCTVHRFCQPNQIFFFYLFFSFFHTASLSARAQSTPLVLFSTRLHATTQPYTFNIEYTTTPHRTTLWLRFNARRRRVILAKHKQIKINYDNGNCTANHMYVYIYIYVSYAVLQQNGLQKVKTECNTAIPILVECNTYTYFSTSTGIQWHKQNEIHKCIKFTINNTYILREKKNVAEAHRRHHQHHTIHNTCGSQRAFSLCKYS